MHVYMYAYIYLNLVCKLIHYNICFPNKIKYYLFQHLCDFCVTIKPVVVRFLMYPMIWDLHVSRFYITLIIMPGLIGT